MRNIVRAVSMKSEPISPDGVDDVLRRRIRVAPDHLVREHIDTTPTRVQHYLEAGADYALVALYPPSESRKASARVRRFGQAFPGLFNVNGIPRSHDVRPFSTSREAFTGSVQTRHLTGSILLGSAAFRSAIVTNCFLRLEPDTSITLTRLVIKSPRRAISFEYKIFFMFALAFGRVAKPHEFVERFEDSIVSFFERDETHGITEVAEGEHAITSSSNE